MWGIAGISFVDIYNENAYENDSGGSDIWIANSQSLRLESTAAGISTDYFMKLAIHLASNTRTMHGIQILQDLIHPTCLWTTTPNTGRVMSYRDYVGDTTIGIGRPDSHQFTQVLGCAVCGASGQELSTLGDFSQW